MVATVSGSVVTLLLLTTLMVMIAHMRLLNQKVELEGKLADIADVLASERRMFRARISEHRNEQVSDAELAAERLASYSSYIEKQNPDLAVRLAIESTRQSRKASKAVEASAINVLRAFLAKRSPSLPETGSSASQTDSDTSNIIEEIEKGLTYQLTQDQRVLFGIELPVEQSQAEANRNQSQP